MKKYECTIFTTLCLKPRSFKVNNNKSILWTIKFTLICINMPFLGYCDFKFLNDSCFVILSHSFALDLLHIDDLILIL